MTIDTNQILKSFKENGGWFDERIFGLKPFEGMGIGAVALEDIKEDDPLFSTPDSYLLTPNTSKLASLLSAEHWESLGDGWAPLILTMMWEASRGTESVWYGYLNGMPVNFDTPMFWSEEEKAELQGTDLMDRICKEQAEADYHAKVTPVLQAYPAIFGATESFSLNQYHLQGSRILSRSFTVPASRAGKPFYPKSSMEVDAPGDDDEDEEEEDVAVMVPMADMLNAAYEMDNARLFHEDNSLRMVATKNIAKGAQIFNTYGSPNNSQLLRKYGHVDVLSLPEDVLEQLPADSEARKWAFGNPGDEVEIPGNLIVTAVFGEGKEAEAEARVEWWLEEGEDDTFPLTYESPLSDELISFIRLLSSPDDWLRAEKKGKAPKPLIDQSVLDVLRKVIAARESQYPAHLTATLQGLESGSGLTARQRMALIVRLGEQRILATTKEALRQEEETLKAQVALAKKDKKRKAADDGRGSKRGGKSIR